MASVGSSSVERTPSSHSQRQACSWAAITTCSQSLATIANSMPRVTVTSAAMHSRRTCSLRLKQMPTTRTAAWTPVLTHSVSRHSVGNR